MLFDVEKDLFILRELKINPKQLMLIKVLVPDPALNNREEQARLYRQGEMMKTSKCKLTHDEVADLLSREIIINHGKIGGDILYGELELNPRFLKHFSLKVQGMPSSLAEAYPNWFYIQGKRFNAKDCGPVDIAQDYIKAIEGSEEEHARVMDDVAWAIKNDEINCGLLKFVKSKRWNAIRELRDNLSSKTFSDVNIG
jgi:hypothetical protein